jgi:hypothetical protein
MIGILRCLKVRRIEEAQSAGMGVDREESLVGAAGKTKVERIQHVRK